MGYIIIKKKGHIRIKIRCINVGVFPQINIVPGGTGGGEFVLTFVADAGSAWG